MDNSALVPRSEGSGTQLTNQGSIDYIQLARTTISFPLSVLARLAAADVAPHTIAVGQAISSIFILSEGGIKHLTDALRSLPSCSSIGDVVWFGFGIRHIVREIAQTAQGTTFLALCGSLAELHPPKMCAAILMKFAEVCGAPSELRPSAQQWINIVEACSGILRPTTFGCIAGQFMAFSGPHAGSVSHESDNAEDVAAALRAIALISSRNLESVTLAGGHSCGWIAAFGYFFLGLHVEIRMSDGALCYRSAADEDKIHISVVYDGTTPSGLVNVSNRLYRIRTMDSYLSWDARFDSVMSGSVPWDRSIAETFGAAGVQLLEAKSQFACLISCAARVFLGVARAESSQFFDKSDFQTWFGFQSGQGGFGYLDSAISRFPELEPLRSHIHLDLDMPVDDAVDAYAEAAEEIRALCGCYHCTSDSTWGGYCLPVLAETLIFLVWNLSGMRLGSDLKPYRSGLRFMYEIHSGQAEMDDKFGERYGGGQYRGAYWGDIVVLVRLLDVASIYHTAQFLFTTNLYPQTTYSTFTAASVGGMCFYFSILRDVSDAPERVILLHVLPGGITTPEGRKYSYVLDKTGLRVDGHLGLDWRDNYSYESLPEFTLNYTCDPPQLWGTLEPELGNNTGSHDLEASLLVEESLQGLRVDLDISGSRGSCRVGVYQLLRAIIESSGVIHCSRRNCVTVQPVSDSTWIVDGEGCMPGEREQGVYIRRLAGNPLARCVGLLVREGWTDDVLLRRQECLQCCVRTAVENPERLVYVIL